MAVIAAKRALIHTLPYDPGRLYHYGVLRDGQFSDLLPSWKAAALGSPAASSVQRPSADWSRSKAPYGKQVRFKQIGLSGRPEAIASPMELVEGLSDKPDVELFTAVLQSPNLKRWLRVVVLRSQSTGDYVLLASSDPQQVAEEAVAYYRLRCYQLELRIRDGKQHAGLYHCQARSQEKIDFHVNLSMTAVNLGRWEVQRRGPLSAQPAARSSCAVYRYPDFTAFGAGSRTA